MDAAVDTFDDLTSVKQEADLKHQGRRSSQVEEGVELLEAEKRRTRKWRGERGDATREERGARGSGAERRGAGAGAREAQGTCLRGGNLVKDDGAAVVRERLIPSDDEGVERWGHGANIEGRGGSRER
eukprot:747439-Hanusia_phi.AAC.1